MPPGEKGAAVAGDGLAVAGQVAGTETMALQHAGQAVSLGSVRYPAPRRKLAATATAVSVLAAACVAGVLVIGRSAPSHPAPDHDTATSRVVVRLAAYEDIMAMAASGPYLYLATDSFGGPPYAIAAYSGATGRLIRRVTIPAEPATVAVGPGHSVWLTLSPNQWGGPCGTWLFAAGLDRRSSASLCSVVLPTGPTTALTGDVLPGWVGTLALPPPGQPGRATVEPSAKIGNWAVDSLARVGSYVAAFLSNDTGDGHLVIIGQRGLSIRGVRGLPLQSEAGHAGSLWVTTASPTKDPSAGPLVRLDAHLRPTTPQAILANPALQQSEHVWSDGNTIWVATSSPAHRLVCFTDGAELGRFGTIRVPGDVSAFAAAGHTVYVPHSMMPTVVGMWEVLSYPIPRQCL